MAELILYALFIAPILNLTSIMAPNISYSREELLQLQPDNTSGVGRVPISTYRTLQDLGICSSTPTKRGCRGGRVKYPPISRVIDYSPIKNKLNLRVWNSQSVCNKTDKLRDYVTDHDIDILCLTETWLRPEDPVVIGELSPVVTGH